MKLQFNSLTVDGQLHYRVSKIAVPEEWICVNERTPWPCDTVGEAIEILADQPAGYVNLIKRTGAVVEIFEREPDQPGADVFERETTTGWGATGVGGAWATVPGLHGDGILSGVTKLRLKAGDHELTVRPGKSPYAVCSLDGDLWPCEIVRGWAASLTEGEKTGIEAALDEYGTAHIAQPDALAQIDRVSDGAKEAAPSDAAHLRLPASVLRKISVFTAQLPASREIEIELGTITEGGPEILRVWIEGREYLAGEDGVVRIGVINAVSRLVAVWFYATAAVGGLLIVVLGAMGLHRILAGE